MNEFIAIWASPESTAGRRDFVGIQSYPNSPVAFRDIWIKWSQNRQIAPEKSDLYEIFRIPSGVLYYPFSKM